jgi:hypothetical protein
MLFESLFAAFNGRCPLQRLDVDQRGPTPVGGCLLDVDSFCLAGGLRSYN